MFIIQNLLIRSTRVLKSVNIESVLPINYKKCSKNCKNELSTLTSQDVCWLFFDSGKRF